MLKIIIGRSPITAKLVDTLSRLLMRDTRLLIATDHVIRETGSPIGVVLLSAGEDTAIEDAGSILLLPRAAALPIIRAPLTLVADSARDTWPGQFAGELISCGRSAKDTLTLSSHTEDSAVVTLLRQMRDLSGRVVEPCEFPVLLLGGDPFVAFAAVSVLLLTGRIGLLSEIGYSANNLQL